jgi:diguanylate cyclase (GGDEF)-like protein
LLGEIVQLNIQLEEKQTELADANVRLEQLAITDQITGLYNRHHFFDVVRHIFEEARRYKLPLCCFMLDADHFKALNDTHGHMFGDQVLRGISDRLKANTRRSDVLARYGGEEFVMVAPNTDMATASLLAERLRACIAREPFTLGTTTARVTISLGVAGTEVVDKGPFDELLVCADRALYRAKQGGRNQFRMHTAADAGSDGPTGTQSGAVAGR